MTPLAVRGQRFRRRPGGASHRVVLLDGVDVQALELHHRLHVALERVELPQPRDLGSSLGLLRDLGQLAVAALVLEQRVGGSVFLTDR